MCNRQIQWGKGDFETPNVLNRHFSQSPISTVFAIVWFPGGAKTVLSGESLYLFFSQHIVHRKVLPQLYSSVKVTGPLQRSGAPNQTNKIYILYRSIIPKSLNAQNTCQKFAKMLRFKNIRYEQKYSRLRQSLQSRNSV